MVADAAVPLARRRRLWAEFAALYLGAPLAIALLLDLKYLLPGLAVFSLGGMVMLWQTGGFDWRSLVRTKRFPWNEVAGIAVATLVVGTVILWSARPEELFIVPRERPAFLLVIWLFYPILSALPQELIFRPLFFHRYAAILPQGRAVLALNAAIFSFAHLMYWSIVVTVLSFIGGWFFARAYLRHGFPAAWMLHAVAGNVIFGVGMGYYFFSGNVVRPF